MSVDPDGDAELWAAANVDLANVHPPERCAGQACVIHNPSDHHMRSWPLVWRGKMERICPHGIGHPDPDESAYLKSMGYGGGVHGCDRCCVKP